MIDKEKTTKELESLRDICNAKSYIAVGEGRVMWAGYANAAADAIALLKEQEKQVQQWTKEIADNQLAHAPDELDRENWDYKKGIWDGLQIAWNIISEGR